jgi:hypothetical protein
VQNSKDGAIIISNDFTVYRIKGKSNWKTSLIGKTIKAELQILGTEYLSELDLGIDTNIRYQGRIGQIYDVKLLTLKEFVK